jgi:hypothetical protein
MSNRTATVTASALRNVEWSSVADASGPILRRAALGAILSDDRVEIAFDVERGTYELGGIARN